jgi:DNA-binding NarL/FixJ family response regulator
MFINEVNLLRILVVDNHTEVLKQIETRLSYEKDFEVCVGASLSEMTRCVMECRPDVLLIDPYVNNAYRFDVIRLAKKISPEMTVVVLTAVVDKAAEMRLKSVGVSRILEKGGDSSQLIDALRGIIVHQYKES